MIWRRKRIGPLLARAEAAQRRGDWRSVARAYEAVLAIRPDDAAIWVQLGHAARALADPGRARSAYERAIRLEPRNADAHQMLGHLLKSQGDRAGAIAAYAEAVRLDPDRDGARDELAAMGAREALPRTAYDLDRIGRADAHVSATLAELAQALAHREAVTTFPVSAYDAFRRTWPIAPPPGPDLGGPITILIDARGVTPFYLRATLVSLLDQTRGDWTAHVVADADVEAHPVASLAAADPRIAIGRDAPADRDGPWLALHAGTALDPTALAWFGFAAARTGADLVYCDHDRLLDHPHVGRVHAAPVFEGVADAERFATAERLPIALLSRRRLAGSVREALVDATPGRTVAHVPRVLASLLAIPEVARNAPEDAGVVVPSVAAASVAPGEAPPVPAPAIVSPAARDRLLVVMPTRDQPALIGEAVERLLDLADRPDRLRIAIADNRSVGADTRAALATLARRPQVDVRLHDEPFNWSRVNNVAAATATADETRLLFVNDDTRMLTPGWDRLLEDALARETIGAVGARLLYPDGTLQHGGIVLGVGPAPRHEGVGAARADPGPEARWRRPRMVSAVTGAFLAVRRTVFDAVGGFDERGLAIGYNDIDFCLRVRAGGRTILYEPRIEVLHHESKTRAQNVARDKVAWDQSELRTLRDRWGASLDRDPGYGPYWSRGPVPFDGLREPPMSEIVAWIDASAAARPWTVPPPA